MELFKIGTGPFLDGRLNTIPVVPRPAGLRPGGFRRPTTTPRPFRKRPTTPRQPLPIVRPPTRPPSSLPVVHPQPSRPQVQSTTVRPVPQETFDTNNLIIDTSSNLASPQFPIVVPDVPTTIPIQPQNPIVVISETPNVGITNGQPNGSFQPPLTNPFQPSQPEYTPNIPEVPVSNVPETPEFPATSVPQGPPIPNIPQSPLFPETPSNVIDLPQRPTLVPQSPLFPIIVPETPSMITTIVERPPEVPSLSQPPFEGPNIPPERPPSPTFTSSQINTGAGGGRPQEPLSFPVARPPLTTVTSRPTFRPKPPPGAKPPSAQPPFDSGPHVPPKPPAVPSTSTTSFGVNPAELGDKPQRPLPPSRPILLNPQPLPKPPYQLTTTEKPAIIFNESSMSNDGNYMFE